MCFQITLNERWRRVFGLMTTVFNTMLIFLALSLLVVAIAIRRKLDSRLEVLEDYDSGALPYFLIVTACLLFVVHLVACKFCYDATYVDTRSSKHHYFVAIIVVLVIMSVYLFICWIVTLAHSYKIRDAVELGMKRSMKLYKSDLTRKERVDTVQVEFECCGVRSYRDWLTTAWVNMAFVNIHSPEVQPFIHNGEFIKDDVPFSCCSRYAKRACVHHSVKTPGAHKLYETGNTLYPRGCIDVMTDFFHSTLIAPTAILILVVLIMQIVTTTLMRYLQTSIESADEMNDPEGDGAAYCLKSLGGGGDVRRYLKRKNSEDTESDEDHDDDERPQRRSFPRRESVTFDKETMEQEKEPRKGLLSRDKNKKEKRRGSTSGDDKGGKKGEKDAKKDAKAKKKKGKEGKKADAKAKKKPKKPPKPKKPKKPPKPKKPKKPPKPKKPKKPKAKKSPKKGKKK